MCVYTYLSISLCLKFPVRAEPDHSAMLKKVRGFPYVLPDTFNSALVILLTEVCKCDSLF